MKILAIGTGESCDNNTDKIKNLQSDIVKLAYGNSYLFMNDRGIDVDYWTWMDPHAVIQSLRLYLSKLESKRPKVFLPWFLTSIHIINTKCAGTPLNSDPEGVKFYDETLKHLIDIGEIEVIKDAKHSIHMSPNDPVFSDPTLRFKETLYYGTVPLDSRASESNYARENLFSRMMLPLGYRMGATEIYNIGFDNRGLGFGRRIPQFHNQDVNIIPALQKFQTWLDWEKYHGMKIFSVAEDKYTPNNQVLPYKSLDELTTSN